MEDIAQKIEDFYLNKLHELNPEKRFHFLSRLYLFTNENKYKELLLNYRNDLFEDNLEKQLLRIYSNDYIDKALTVEGEREKYLKKYPNISKFNKIFFLIFFAERILDLKIEGEIKTLLMSGEVKKYFDEILSDSNALRILSSVAINFLFLSNQFFDFIKEDQLNQIILQILSTCDFSTLNSIEKKQLCYTITHAILNNSSMYTKVPVRNIQSCRKMLEILLEKISNKIDDLPLDVLAEILMCSKLADIKLSNEEILLVKITEAYDPIKGFIVDPIYTNDPERNNIDRSEHRNILFILFNKQR